MQFSPRTVGEFSSPGRVWKYKRWMLTKKSGENCPQKFTHSSQAIVEIRGGIKRRVLIERTGVLEGSNIVGEGFDDVADFRGRGHLILDFVNCVEHCSVIALKDLSDFGEGIAEQIADKVHRNLAWLHGIF